MKAENAEISLLDLLVLAVENLELMIFEPILVRLVAFSVAFVLPKSFEVRAVLAIPAFP